MRRLTRKERVIMEYYWTYGPMFIRELQEHYPDPKPSFGTLSNQVRTLQADGFMSHNAFGTNYQYYPIVDREQYSKSGINGIVDEFFSSSYSSVVMSFVKDEKLSVEELEQIIKEIKKQQ
ncbi:MAG: BlaI/MecI/CopY family transcriptional regulator [Bacteroidaceae bacterium]|nr:BlaI/MecI/CopY family transcriptional regulator [Bacteroidaceae bacterium]